MTTRYSSDRMARFIVASVKLVSPDAGIDTYSDSGFVTLPNGQVFRFTAVEVTPEEAAAVMASWPADVRVPSPGDALAGNLSPARLSADLAMSDGRTVHVPVVPQPGPASVGRIRVAIPYPDSAMPGLVVSAAVTNEDLGVIFRSGFPYTRAEPGDTLTVEFGEESLDADALAKILGEWP